ncbi:glycosyltransferase [Flavisolibacter nicotianae]|uniref:glycosyltransferase n=1 Tax=Flavisolibacter nicotianae TaxID=2364882 RepID=UPI000EB14BB2|nr:glycosyltransferase family A protein [Flavisolibacter nicotianae]
MENATPKVSVLVPAYNEEKYILKTLEALQQQDYTNCEVLIINNASTDRTAEVVRSFIYRNHLTFKFRLLNEGRQGTQFARECGRKNATGVIIAQLDADCLPSPNWISNGVKLLQQKGIAAVAGPYDYFDGKFLVRTLTYFSQLLVLQPLNTIVQVFRKGGVVIGGNVFIHAAILERAGGYNTALCFYGDDVDIALKVSRYGHILFTRKITVKSSSRRYNAKGFFNVQAKYTRAFFQSLFRKGINAQQSVELAHPR